MRISNAVVYLLNLPLQEAFSTSHGDTATRIITIVQIETDQGIGWGECSALPAATYTSEWAAGAFDLTVEHLFPLVAGCEVTSSTLNELLASIPGNPMAKSGLEMAVLDVELRSAGISLAQWLGVSASHVPAGVSLGITELNDTIARAVSLAEQGFGRIKAKIQPGHDLVVAAALSDALPSMELQLDANGAYEPNDIDRVVALADHNIRAIEQPFAADDPSTAAELVRRLKDEHVEVLVMADEAVSTLRDAQSLLSAGSLTGLSIKPARVGGLHKAKELHDFCVTSRLAATAGGMLETGLGRHALAAFAGLPGLNLTGDLSPASRWLAADPWPDVEMNDGRIVVPTEAGIAPRPDRGLIDHHCLDRRLLGQR